MIAARNVTVNIGDKPIVVDVSLDVRDGEVLALVGPNGAGKSTLLAVLAGDLTPSEGVVELAGAPIRKLRPARLALERAVLTQDNQVAFTFTARDVVQMGRAPWTKSTKGADDEAVVAESMRATDIEHLADRRFASLSGGERARVSLARVLAQRTPVVLLDEPTAALDLRHQEDVMRVARALATDGRAVVVVLHDLSLAGAWADRVALLRNGRLYAEGAPSDVLTEANIGDVYELPVAVTDLAGSPVVTPRRDLG